MKKSIISFEIELDDKNLPDKIKWSATDSQKKDNITKAIAVSLWDPNQNNTLKIDLWTKDMRVDEMDKFMVDTLGGLSQTMLTATGDTFISESIDTLCDKLVEHIKNKNYK
jgi:gliding motility-associated protein GldC